MIEPRKFHACSDCHIEIHTTTAFLCESCKAHRADGHAKRWFDLSNDPDEMAFHWRWACHEGVPRYLLRDDDDDE